MTTYIYKVDGTGSNGQVWTTVGNIETEKLGDFPEVPMKVLRQSFIQLTGGEAVFGLPGVGCEGPYTITRMLIEQQDEKQVSN